MLSRRLTRAQVFLMELFGPDSRPPIDYKAPHAYRGTPPKRRRGKLLGVKKRLFKGHRV